MGYANEIQQKYAEAHAAYKQSFDLNQKNTLAVFGEGHVNDLEGKREQAKQAYTLAVRLDYRLGKAHAGLARIAMAEGDTETAQKEFAIAYQFTANARERADAYYSIGMLLNAKDDTMNARAYLEQAMKDDPSYPPAYYGEGVALFGQAVGTSTNATVEQRVELLTSSFLYLAKAAELNPDQTVAYVQLAKQHIFVGRTQKALDALNEAARAVKTDITLDAAARATLASEIDKAIVKATAAIKN